MLNIQPYLLARASVVTVLATVFAACAADTQDEESNFSPDGDGDSDESPSEGDGETDPDGPGGGPDSRDGGTGDAGQMVPPGSYQEVFDKGLLRYVGKPQVQETSLSKSGSIDIHHFSKENRGPVCMYGDEFFVETREGSSDTLMIWLQGGGVCLTEVCAATPTPILSLQLFDVASIIGVGGLLDPRNMLNPTKDFDVVNAPYCDGSLFSGDVDRILSDGKADNGEEDQAYQRGLQNLTATLETAKKLHPNPPRIVLAGSSGGAYGVIMGTVLARHYYPDTPLLVVADSGAPIVNGPDPSFIESALTQLKVIEFLPDSCPDCISNGHATGMIEWAMRIDPKLSIAYMGHARDHVIGEFFMGTTADEFEEAVVAETDHLLKTFPGRTFRFVVPSAKHTLTMDADSLGDLQSFGLGIAGGLGVGFVGPAVNSEELQTWQLGGMKEVGKDEDGKGWTAYEWLESVLNDPKGTPDVLQLK